MLGVSTVSTFAESTAGVADGAKTGLASLVTGSCFLLAIPFSPIVSAASRPHACVCVCEREREGERERENERTRERSGIQCVLSLKSEVPPLASGPILCLLGAMMCSSVKGVDWDDFQESIITSQEGESFGTTDITEERSTRAQQSFTRDMCETGALHRDLRCTQEQPSSQVVHVILCRAPTYIPVSVTVSSHVVAGVL